VLGKNMTTVEAPDMPFAYIQAEGDGRTAIIPGMNLYTVGTVRDGAKWPTRDRRKSPERRDFISFDVFSPFTAGKMQNGIRILSELNEKTPKTAKEVKLGGAVLRRLLIKTCIGYYTTGVEMYVLGKVLSRAEHGLQNGGKGLRTALGEEAGAVYSRAWVDVGGLLMPKDRLDALEADLAAGRISTAGALRDALKKIESFYAKDEWAWVRRAFQEVCGKDAAALTKEELAEKADAYLKTRGKFIKLVLADAEKEFGEGSALGFGLDGEPGDRMKDFEAVRGRMDTNKFIQQMKAELEALEKRMAAFKNKLAAS
jgi:hypothetical protein